MGPYPSGGYRVAGQDPAWRAFECPGSTSRWRYLGDGRIEIEGSGTPTRTWPEAVDEWQAPIAASAVRHGVPAAWIAAIMAFESGGKQKACPGGVCTAALGNGLMQVLPSTATMIEGRPVTQQELLEDPVFNIEVGVKALLGCLGDKWGRKGDLPVGGDFVRAAIAYNAGGVRCGRGRTWMEPHEYCPPTSWGVVMDCVRGKDRGGCSPSELVPGSYICSSDYPGAVIRYVNMAIERGWGDLPPGLWDGMQPEPLSPAPQLVASAGRLLWLVAGGAAGYLGVRWLSRAVLHLPPRPVRARAAHRGRSI